MKLIRPLASLAAMAGVAAVWAADPIRMDVQNTFNGPTSNTSAVTVSLENDGPDARGVVIVSSDSGETTYPVELPRGARKKLLTLPTAAWGTLRFDLNTNQGSISRTVPSQPPSFDMGGSIALIGDDNGGLGFLRKQTENKRNYTVRDGYVKPEDAPDRPAAYSSYNAVALGPGAERMSDGTADALKDFALSGGTVLIFGGASAPILEDARWKAVLPGRDWKPVTISRSEYLSEQGQAPLSDPFTVLEPGSIAAGTKRAVDGGKVVETERPYGLGRIVVLGYSPLEAPLSTWPGRSALLGRYVRQTDGQRARGFTTTYLGGQSQEESFAYGPAVSRTMTISGPGGVHVSGPMTPSALAGPGAPTEDPFSTKLPKTGAVFGLLATYFVLVVPVSFLVLRKLKKGEWAWITAPILSIGFAGLLFTSAQGLYSASLSSATRGVLVLEQGSPNGVFFGTSQLFFPRGGTYDLKLQNVDRMSGVSTEEYSFGYRGRSAPTEGFNLVDVGQIMAPQFEASNLAFREMSYVQRVPQANWFRFERRDLQHVTVTNGSPYAFHGSVVEGPFEGTPFDLAPGERKEVAMTNGDKVAEGSSLQTTDPRNFTRWSTRVALYGKIDGFRPGPQIGKEVASHSGVDVVAFGQAVQR